MNFDEAIGVHAEWKVRLRACLADSERCGLRAPEVARDDGCDLGRWIHGDGASFGSHPEFRVLAEQHRKVHLAAADVVRTAQAGELLHAESILLGEYMRRSSAVISAILEMKLLAERAGR